MITQATSLWGYVNGSSSSCCGIVGEEEKGVEWSHSKKAPLFMCYWGKGRRRRCQGKVVEEEEKGR